MFKPDAEDLDIVFLKKFPDVVFAKPHRVVADVNLMSGPKMTSHFQNLGRGQDYLLVWQHSSAQKHQVF